MSLLLDGSWVDGHGSRFDSRNPVTQEVVWTGAAASPPQVEAAVAAARRAFPAWRDTPLPERLALVQRFVQLLSDNKAMLADKIGMDRFVPAMPLVGKHRAAKPARTQLHHALAQRRQGVAFIENIVQHQHHAAAHILTW